MNAISEMIHPCCNKKISNWLTFIGYVCTHAVLDCTEDKREGPGLMDEIVEAKFRKRRINVKDVFQVPCLENKINGLALIDIMTSNVTLGSSIILDRWKVYGTMIQDKENHLIFKLT
ncbi:hypothetical protein RF11_02965 [Thelohanellus kitauei]|uniref:ISXO2-like transposase domain-containing protein n=1 Tax=Thelohanellus kitauei TaxID=669202 RepID=A0A0C2JPZ0_THEKT|nr:hypothetical protein RF11_02965 [Thelohanellus kitauei]